jgi:hypothetical protein
MMAGLGPLALFADGRLSGLVEIFAERPAFGIKEMAAEQIDDAGSPAQITPLARCCVPREEGLEKMHMRVAPAQLGTV